MPRDRSTPPCRRYRRVAVTYTVAREQPPAAWPRLSSPEAAADFARELLSAHDDDREHFWVIFLNAQNGTRGTISSRRAACPPRSSTPARCWGPRSARAPRT